MVYRFGVVEQKRKRYQLPSAQPVVVPTPRKPLLLPSSVRGTTSGEMAALDRVRQRARNTSRRVQTFTVNAPEGYRSIPHLGEIEMLVANEREMPGLLGSIQFRINEQSVNLDRIRFGQVALHRDHDVSDPVGRIVQGRISDRSFFALCHISDTKEGRSYLEGIQQGMKIGISPGIIVDDLSMREGKDGAMNQIITKQTPYEISALTTPRNQDARLLLRGFSMNGTAMTGTPELVNTSDVIALELACLRLALETKQGSPRQRKAMQTYLSEYDRLIGTGMNGHLAATQAAAEAKRSA